MAFTKIKFKTVKSARKGQSDFKKKYGYRPNLFIQKTSSGKIKGVVIIKPIGLKKL